jgi:hypothetical protein
MKDASVMIPGDKPAPESFWRTMWQDSRVRAVLGLALLIRLLILGYLAIYPGGIFAKGDTKDYLQLAQNLHYYHTFGREPMGTTKDVQKLVAPPVEGGEKVTLIPETFRTPVYPVFLALIYGVSGSPFAVVVVQSLLSLLTVWLIILLMARLFRPEAGWLAGLLAAMEPLGLTYTHQLMTESLFLFFIILGFYVFLILVTADNQKRVNLPWAILGGLAIGLATLTRPVGIYFPVFLLALWIIGGYVGGWKAWQEGSAQDRLQVRPPLTRKLAPSFPYLAIFFAVMILPPSIWAVRNYHYFHRVLISSLADHDLLATITSHVVARVRNPEGNVSSWQMFQELEDELVAQMAQEGFKNPSGPEKAAYFRNWSLGVIMDHPGLSIWYYFKGMAILFIPDVPGFYELLGLTQEGKGALGAVFREGLRPALSRYFGKYWVWWAVAALPLILYDLWVYGLAILGVTALWRTRNFFRLFLILALMGYWLALAAIGAAPRYRLPLMPFLIILAAWGWFNFRNPAADSGQPALSGL